LVFVNMMLNKQSVTIKELETQNEIYKKNAEALKNQQEELKKIQQSVLPLQGMIAKIPTETKEKLKDAYITKVNDCIVYFGNTGVLPESCKADLHQPESTD
jgi:type VI protein secretion system component VasF